MEDEIQGPLAPASTGERRRVERARHVVVQEAEAGLVPARVQVTLVAGQQVVDAEHLIATIEKGTTQMGADEARSARYQGSAGRPRAHSTIHRSTSRRYDTSPSPPKNNATSLAADCGESEP